MRDVACFQFLYNPSDTCCQEAAIAGMSTLGSCKSLRQLCSGPLKTLSGGHIGAPTWQCCSMALDTHLSMTSGVLS